MLPIATVSEESSCFLDALFTATSAVCVTGLVVHNTATYWTLFGQAVILVLIQIGGMGIVTVVVSISMAAGRRIGLMQRSTLQDALSAHHVGGIVKLTGFRDDWCDDPRLPFSAGFRLVARHVVRTVPLGFRLLQRGL